MPTLARNRRREDSRKPECRCTGTVQMLVDGLRARRARRHDALVSAAPGCPDWMMVSPTHGRVPLAVVGVLVGVLAMFAPSRSWAAPTQTWYEGWCVKGDGISVVVDYSLDRPATPPAGDMGGWQVHCVSPASAMTEAVDTVRGSWTSAVLKSAGFQYATNGSGLITTVVGISAKGSDSQSWHFATDKGDGSLLWDVNGWESVRLYTNVDNTNRFISVTLTDLSTGLPGIPLSPPTFATSRPTPSPSGSEGPGSPSSGSPSSAAPNPGEPTTSTGPTAQPTSPASTPPPPNGTGTVPASQQSTALDQAGATGPSGSSTAEDTEEVGQGRVSAGSASAHPTVTSGTALPGGSTPSSGAQGSAQTSTSSSPTSQARVWGDDATPGSPAGNASGVRIWALVGCGAMALGGMCWALVTARARHRLGSASDPDVAVSRGAEGGSDNVDGEEPW